MLWLAIMWAVLAFVALSSATWMIVEEIGAYINNEPWRLGFWRTLPYVLIELLVAALAVAMTIIDLGKI